MIFSMIMVVLASCNESTVTQDPNIKRQPGVDSVVAFNHQIVQTEIQDIEDYMLRYHWDMKQSQTGLHYMIYKAGDGPLPKQGDIVSIKFRVNLLNGNVVDRSDSLALFSFEPGKRDVASGLEEGVMLMNKGSRAKLILPSHLAFGLLGDLEKIPSRAVLVYDVEVCKINRLKK